MELLFTPYALLVIAIVLASIYSYSSHSLTKKLAPKAGGGWPIIGHLHLLSASDQLPHQALATMADKYGPIFRINLGLNQALVISSWEMAKDCLLTNDKVVLERGKTIGAELLSYNYVMFGFAPYGPYWRHMRKMVEQELLSKHRCNMLSDVMESEVRKSVRKIYEQWMVTNTAVSNTSKNNVPVLIDMTKMFTQFTLNLTLKILFGKQLEEDNDEALRISKAITLFLVYIGTLTIGDLFPFMRWMDLGGQEKAMKECFKEIDSILQGWLEEHKQYRSNNNNMKNFVNQDFMDVMLTAFDEDGATKNVSYDVEVDTINKATCLTILTGATDTNKATLVWVLSLLLNHQEVLKRAKEELNIHIGKERQVSISDIPKLEYLQAIVKETMQLYPAAPLMGPREFSEDCIIGDYHVKSGTKLIVNVSKISSDPRVWNSPLEFRPERFLDGHENVDVRGHHFELIPFGAGRRKCPGINFGLQMVHLCLATFLHAFEFSTQHDAPIDLNECFGLVNFKATPLEALLNPSLSSKVYAS